MIYHALDITDPTSVDTFTQWLAKEYGHLDILVNNAGDGGGGGQLLGF